jgi:hypothetical protein
MAQTYSFTKDAFKRTRAAVLRVESTPRVKNQTQRRRHVVRGSGGNGIAVLSQALSYGTTVGATAWLYTGDPGSETADREIQVFEWMMRPGDSVPANTQIVVSNVNGHWYAFNAACKNIYGS